VTERPAYVYLLRCRDGSLYCGWTYDVAKRAAAHGRGTASKYTGARLPVEVAAVFQLRDASAARREEARIKTLSRAQKLALVESGPRDAGAVRVG
jgi:putative endonuclease